MTIPDGIALTPFDETFNKDPYPVYASLRDQDPVHQDSVSFYASSNDAASPSSNPSSNPSSWTISEYSTVKQLLSDKRLTVDPRAVGIRRDPREDNPVTLRDPDMMSLDGSDHARLRKLVQKAFTPTSVNQFSPRIRAIINTCLDEISTGTFDIVPTLAKPIPTIIIAEFIGVDSDRHQDFKRWTDALLLQGYPMPTDAQWREIVAADQALRDYVRTVISRRHMESQDDLVSRLIAAQDEDERLTDQEIIDMCCLLIGAGNFTTTDLISNSIYHALTQGASDSTLLANPDQSKEIVAEVLRFDSPVLAVQRFATEDITLGSKTITKGSAVNLLLGAANHDPLIFPRPDQFELRRDQNLPLTFGRGAHHCLGAALAKLEASITLHLFLERFPHAKVFSAKRRKQMNFRGFSSLVVTER